MRRQNDPAIRLGVFIEPLPSIDWKQTSGTQL
jgi:hypothetical protein